MTYTRFHARDDDDSGETSTSTIIPIVVVCGALFALLLILFLWRSLTRLCRRQESVPLPPVQLLAHHRGQRAFSFVERKTLYETESLRGLAYAPFHQASSEASLTPASSLCSGRPNSDNVDDAASADGMIGLGPPISTDDAVQPPVLPCDNHSDATSIASHATTTPYRPQPSISRPFSMASSAGTIHTMRSAQSRRSVLCGTPHSRLSNIQIVLPAPLAPEIYPYNEIAQDDGTSSLRSSYLSGAVLDDTSSRRSSLADQWVPVGSSRSVNQTVAAVNPAPRPRRSTTTAHPRVPSSLSQSITAPTSHKANRRSRSQPHLNATVRSSSPLSMNAPPPPVPQIPSIYNTVRNGEMGNAELGWTRTEVVAQIPACSRTEPSPEGIRVEEYIPPLPNIGIESRSLDLPRR